MKSKVGLLGPSNWAIGSINRFLQKHLGDQGYIVKKFDWDHSSQIWDCFNWSDVFIAEVHMYEKWTRSSHIPYDIRKKGMYVWHHLANIPHLPITDKIDTRHFTSRIRWEQNPSLKDNFFAITKDTKASVKDYYGLDVDMLPVGTEPSFWAQQDIRSIKKIGHVSSPEQQSDDYKLVKRFDMFLDIVDKSGLEGERVFGKNILTGSYIYKGFDAIVNTSTHEGLPTPLLECAPAKIPFISTKCGIVPQYSSIKTFETVEEAVEILKELNSDEKILRKYVNDVYDDVVPANEYSKLVPEYYVPAIERVIKQNRDRPTKEVVVSHYENDLSWTKDLYPHNKLTVYSKSDKGPDMEHIKLPNAGMIEHTIFHHLATRYDNLADYTFFCQDNPFDHVPDFLDCVNDFDPKSDNNALLHKDGYWGFFKPNKYITEPRPCCWDGYPEQKDRSLKIDEVWDELFETEKPQKLVFFEDENDLHGWQISDRELIPELDSAEPCFTFVPSAHPCVSKEQVHVRSKKFYQKVAEMAKTREYGPWEIERVTWAIFDKDIVARC